MWGWTNWKRSTKKPQITATCCFVDTLKLLHPFVFGTCFEKGPAATSWDWLERKQRAAASGTLLWMGFKLLASVERREGKMHCGKAASAVRTCPAQSTGAGGPPSVRFPSIRRPPERLRLFSTSKKVTSVWWELFVSETEIDFQSRNRFPEHNGSVSISVFLW